MEEHPFCSDVAMMLDCIIVNICNHGFVNDKKCYT